MDSVRKNAWLVSAGWDIFFIHNIIWILAIFIVAADLGFLHDTSRFFSTKLYFYVHWGHGLAPIILFWFFRELRKDGIQSTRIVPLQIALFLFVLTIAAWAVFMPEHWFLDSSSPLLILSTMFFVWNTFHCGKQHFGVLAIYRGQADTINENGRRNDYIFSMGITCVILPVIWLSRSSAFRVLPNYIPKIPNLILISQIALVLGLLLFAWTIFNEIKSKSASTPRYLYIFTVGVQPLLSFISYPIYHATIFIISHAIIEIGLCSKVFAGYFDERAKKFKRKLSFSAWRLGFMLFLGICVFLSWFLALNHFGYSKYIMPLVRNKAISLPAMDGLAEQIGLVLLLTIPIYIVFSHFLHDAYFWAFRKKVVRENVGKYLME